jgi:hypothetical protein
MVSEGFFDFGRAHKNPTISEQCSIDPGDYPVVLVPPTTSVHRFCPRDIKAFIKKDDRYINRAFPGTVLVL